MSEPVKMEFTVTVATGNERAGLWCETCLTPAVAEWDIFDLRDDGPHFLTSARHCFRCEADQ